MRSTFDGSLENAPLLSLTQNIVTGKIAERLDGDDVVATYAPALQAVITPDISTR